MSIFVCYFVSYVGDYEMGSYSDFCFLDQLGAFTTALGAYKALLNWAEHLYTRSNVRGYEDRYVVIVDGREYCVGHIELHDE